MAAISRNLGLFVALVVTATFAGCVSNSGGVRTATLNNQVDPSEAFMVPPPGGPAIIAVLEQRYQNALAQDIVLENNSSVPGENVLYVRAFGPMGRDAGRNRLGPDIPSLSGIQRELRQRFPGIGMQVSGLYAQNRYGPIGYATGRSSSGVSCIYVWQRIAPEPRLVTFQRGSITWRLRLCEPNTSVRDLLLTAYGFTVVGYFDAQTWNPFGEPPAPDERIGKPGEVILPETTVDPTVVAPRSFTSPPRQAAPSAPVRRRSAPAAVSEPTPPVLNRPVTGAAVVPRPENTNLAEPTVRSTNLPVAAPAATGVTTPTQPAPAPGTYAPAGPRVIRP